MEHLQFLSALSRRLYYFQRKIVVSAVASQLKIEPKPRQAVNTGNVQKYRKLLGLVKDQTPPAHVFMLQRYYSGEFKSQDKLKLMDFPFIFWPNILKTIKNWIYTSLLIRPYMDPEFSLHQFVEGAKLAAEVVSNKLSVGKLDDLHGLLTPDCMLEVQRNLALLSTKQRHEIAIQKDDIYFSFPYELGILFEDGKPNSESGQQRMVEITVVHHVLKGRKELMDRGEPIPLNIGTQPEFREKIFILNYRFIRNFSKGVDDQWTVNVVNHFKPAEYSDD